MDTVARGMQTERPIDRQWKLPSTCLHNLAQETSSNLSRPLLSGCEPLRFPLSIGAGIFAIGLLFIGPVVGAAAELAISCSEPSMEASRVVVVRCHLESGAAEGGWSAVYGGQRRWCGGFAVASRLPVGPGAQCGMLGEEVWFWEQLAAPPRGSLRYRSWAKGDMWRVEGSALLPERLFVGASEVTAGRWDGKARTDYGSHRDRGWLGGSVSSTRQGAVDLVAERQVAGLATPVLEELRRLRERGHGGAIGDIQLLAATRQDYASGRSGPGWMVLELGAGAKAERVAEVVRHEVAHQIVGGAVRLVRSGRDVGWFLEGFADYLGFAMTRDEVMGRAAFFRRFAEACEAVSLLGEEVSEYDLGFLYAAAVDGALWRSAGTGLSARLDALVAGRGGPLVFGGREDFVGNEPRASLVTALLAGATDRGAERARRWMEQEERPDVRALADDLGVRLAKESIGAPGLPLSMRERRDGLFDVTSVQAGAAEALAIAPGDLVWPLASWSGIGEVTFDVSRPHGWQRVTLSTSMVQRERLRVVSVDGAESRWFGSRADGEQR